MADSKTPFKRQGDNSWQAILDLVNEELESPPLGCDPIEPIEDVDECHRWSKSDIQEVYDKLDEMPGGCFEWDDIPDIWKVSVVEDIETQLEDNAWCECDDLCCEPCVNAGPTFIRQFLGSYTSENLCVWCGSIVDGCTSSECQLSCNEAAHGTESDKLTYIAENIIIDSISIEISNLENEIEVLEKAIESNSLQQVQLEEDLLDCPPGSAGNTCRALIDAELAELEEERIRIQEEIDEKEAEKLQKEEERQVHQVLADAVAGIENHRLRYIDESIVSCRISGEIKTLEDEIEVLEEAIEANSLQQVQLEEDLLGCPQGDSGNPCREAIIKALAELEKERIKKEDEKVEKEDDKLQKEEERNTHQEAADTAYTKMVSKANAFRACSKACCGIAPVCTQCIMGMLPITGSIPDPLCVCDPEKIATHDCCNNWCWEGCNGSFNIQTRLPASSNFFSRVWRSIVSGYVYGGVNLPFQSDGTSCLCFGDVGCCCSAEDVTLCSGCATGVCVNAPEPLLREFQIITRGPRIFDPFNCENGLPCGEEGEAVPVF